MPVLLQNYKRIFENDEEVFAIYNRGLRVWPVGDLGPETPDYTEPLYFENITDETETIKFTHYYTGPDVLMQYSFNKTNWVNWGIAGAGHSISLQLPPKFKVWIRSKNDGLVSFGGGFHRFTGMSKVGGNIMSIFYGEDFTGTETVLPPDHGGVKGALFSLFSVIYGQTSTLIDAGSLLLPATTLVTECYDNMFANCTTLLSGPKILPATTLTYKCYEAMFVNCQNLMNTPKLPAQTLAQRSYQQMFQNCYKITSIDCQATDISAADCTLGWTYGVPSSYCCNMNPVEIFYKNANMNSWTTGPNGIPDGWKVVNVGPEPPVLKDYFYVENITENQENLYFYIEGESGSLDTITVEYSSDTLTWTTLGTISTTQLYLQLNAGQKIYLRSTANGWGSSGTNKHVIGGISKVGGNIMSLLYGSNFTGDETSFPSNISYVFSGLFSMNSDLVDASELVLPCTTMTEYCYTQMFEECRNLLYPPVQLPAMNLAYYCYSKMFSGCRIMPHPPQLPATTLVDGCYRQMFYHSGIVESPDLNAEKLVSNCYREMFRSCSSLRTIKCNAKTGLTSSNLRNWTTGVAATGTFYKAAGTTWSTGTNGIPSGWTVVQV